MKFEWQMERRSTLARDGREREIQMQEERAGGVEEGGGGEILRLKNGENVGG